MSQQNTTIIGATPETVRSYLLVLAEALKGTVMPRLDGHAHSIADECAMIATRLAQQISGDPAAKALLAMVATNGADDTNDTNAGRLRDVSAERRAFDLVETEAKALFGEGLHNEPARAFDRQRFENYLQQHPLGGRDTCIVETTMLSGGRSKTTTLITQEGARDLPRQFVLRQDGTGAQQEFTKELVRPIALEYQIMAFAHANGIKAPRTLLLEASTEPMGGAFMAIERCAGSAAGDMFKPLKSDRYALELAAQLGQLHSRPVDSLAATVPMRSSTEAQLSRELAGMREVHQQMGTPSRTVDIALDWMQENIAKVQGPLSLVHGDMAYNNTMAENGHLVAFLDWELSHLGNAAKDLGFVRTSIEQVLPWPQFMAAYEAAGGPVFSPLTIDFYTLWGQMWLYSITQQSRVGVVKHGLKDIELVHYCAHFGPVIMQRMARTLEAVLGKPA